MGRTPAAKAKKAKAKKAKAKKAKTKKAKVNILMSHDIDVDAKVRSGVRTPQKCVVRTQGNRSMTYGIRSLNPTKGNKVKRWYVSSHEQSGVITWKVNGRALHEISPPTEGSWNWEITRQLFG